MGTFARSGVVGLCLLVVPSGGVAQPRAVAGTSPYVPSATGQRAQRPLLGRYLLARQGRTEGSVRSWRARRIDGRTSAGEGADVTIDTTPDLAAVDHSERVLRAVEGSDAFPRVIDRHQENGTHYLVTTHGTHRETFGRAFDVRVRPQNLGQVVRILRSVLAGLRDLHAAGFVHREVRPWNLAAANERRPEAIRFVSVARAARIDIADAARSPTVDLQDAAALALGLVTGEMPTTFEMGDLAATERALERVANPGLRSVLSFALRGGYTDAATFHRDLAPHADAREGVSR